MPLLITRTLKLSESWDEQEKVILQEVKEEIDALFELHNEIKSILPAFEAYADDPTATFFAESMVEKDGDIDVATNRILFKLDDLIKRRQTNSELIRGEMVKSFDFLQFLLRYISPAVVLGGILIALFTVRSIVRPVRKLRNVLLGLSRGVFPKDEKIKSGNDEIGEMSDALHDLVDALQRTTDFSREVGSGNFDYEYQPLSDEDILGHALLKMRDDLAENERILERKVIERTEQVTRAKEEIEQQAGRLEELYKDVTDSIRYAKRLQESILPSPRFVKELLPEAFVLFKPKDIVSGDFYWFERAGSKVLFAAVDCTGHGVPGAFMSLVGHNGLNQAVKEHDLNQPAAILDDLNQLATETLNKHVEDGRVQDGMDLALCALDLNSMNLEFAGAYNPLYVIRDGEVLQTKGDKFAIGGGKHDKTFTNHNIEIKSGDSLYIFSDGYADQFGGNKGKKFMYKKFRDLLISMQDRPMEEQGKLLDSTIEKWKGDYEQVDDILVIGVKIP